MKNFVSRIPLPITALALGWVILGNVFMDIIPFLGDISMIISIVLLCGVIVKLFASPIDFYRKVKSPVGLSVFSCFPLSLIMISPWLKTVVGDINTYIWEFGLIMHTVILVIFTIKYVVNFKLKHIFPSWLLIYYGLGFAAMTSPQFGMIIFGGAIYYSLEFISFIIIPLVLFRMAQRQGTSASQPLSSLLLIPSSVLLLTYLNITEKVDLSKVWILFIITQILIVITLALMIIRMLDGYYPSWSAYVIAICLGSYATKGYFTYLKINSASYTFIKYLLFAQIIIAALVSFFILLIYFINTLENPVKHNQKMAKNMEKSIQRKQKFEEKKLEITQKLNLKQLSKANKEYNKNDVEEIVTNKTIEKKEKNNPGKPSRKQNRNIANKDNKTSKRSDGNLLIDIEDIEDLLD
ncbi:hypothetical protein [Peptostreptococcus equinus]|uniref:Exfoliative toxin A/B n=1 Tax=Peptostreptococcus equinus TaxID=3003601 RepID=A0ABY7JR76_9FIRM|nr:hypothetical protein [Peptostreptococcus sp. CBA3647]WAW14182.1 hypothetical protein O0R46_06115 [Peptostreptococcus sp. CBA3647]